MMKTLKELPIKRKETLKLIEEAFDYTEFNSFEVDFFPLMSPNNAHNNYILIKDDQVIGHIGVLYKTFKLKEHSFYIPMLGGIAIREAYRGKGYFKPFFREVLSKLEDSPFSLLWSDKIELYESFGFNPCIEQYEYTGNIESDSPNFIKMKLHELSEQELIQLKEIYDDSNELRYERSLKDWNDLKNISSSDIYIKKENDRISNYFFMNKGEDLSDIIYEYGSLNDIEEISTYGILWSPWSFDVENQAHKNVLYAALLKINNFNSFQQFIELYTDNSIKLNQYIDEKISFTFEENKMSLNLTDFIQGVFGPNKFQELDHTKKIFISGLDSI